MFKTEYFKKHSFFSMFVIKDIFCSKYFVFEEVKGLTFPFYENFYAWAKQDVLFPVEILFIKHLTPH